MFSDETESPYGSRHWSQGLRTTPVVGTDEVDGHPARAGACLLRVRGTVYTRTNACTHAHTFFKNVLLSILYFVNIY